MRLHPLFIGRVTVVCNRHPTLTDEESDNADVIELLVLDGHADVNARTASGDTPLMLAATVGYEEIVDFIVHVDGEREDSDNEDLVDGFATPRSKSYALHHTHTTFVV